MTTLDAIHNHLSSTLGIQLEPLKVWQVAEAYRMRWRPKQVKTLLLAESHVFTSAVDVALRVEVPETLVKDLPTNFIRLVYCLGYGEDQLLNGPTSEANSGTPQFWKIFMSCTQRIQHRDDFLPILKSKTLDLHTRIHNKLSVLEKMKQEGIWLLDASISALYHNGKKPSALFQQTCLDKSWPYVSKLIMEANPDQIIIIGQGVGRTLRKQLQSLNLPYYVVNQPQARMSKEEYIPYHQRFYDLIHGGDTALTSPTPAPEPIQTDTRPRHSSPKKTRRWTLNDASNSSHHAPVFLSDSPFNLELSFRKDSASPIEYIGSCELNLPSLLEQGFIRYEPAGAISDKVRVRIVHLGNRKFALQVNQANPLYPLALSKNKTDTSTEVTN